MPSIISSEPNWMNFINQIKGSLDMSLSPHKFKLIKLFTLQSQTSFIIVTKSFYAIKCHNVTKFSLWSHVTAVITIVCLISYILRFYGYLIPKYLLPYALLVLLHLWDKLNTRWGDYFYLRKGTRRGNFLNTGRLNL